jgi:quinol monooxygenase YgiN
MFVRLVRFTLSPGKQQVAKAIADDLIPDIKKQPGCISAVCFGGRDDGAGGLCVIWDSQEHADAAAAVISPRLQAHLAGNVKAPAEIALYPVLAN